MPQWAAIASIYLIPALAIVLAYLFVQHRKASRARTLYQDAVESGLLEPASLHPVIDYTRCLGCATCIKACPEKEVLGIIENRAKLITPSSCIGHGACKTACPTQAINLVFGTETRGVDIPLIGADFQTNIPGIYIAGELGGMGLIRNAIEQGRQAVEAIAAKKQAGSAGQLDLVIVGAGPAGISAAMSASEMGLNYQVLEQDTIGGTIAHYPRGKVVMTAPAKLPIVGEFHFGETSKEDLMDFWTQAVDKARLKIETGARVDAIEHCEQGFIVKAAHSYAARNVLLTIGRRGTPRRLGVPGEDHSKVVYRLVDPEQYRGSSVLVVGGGDSALEAAISLSEEPDTRVLLSYRGGGFNRVKAKNRERLASASQSGQLEVEMESLVSSITADKVELQTTGGTRVLDNDAIIVCAGGILPTPFLETVGIEVETRFGTVA
jgi:thioredoxin reductase/NAD-dependent dihydropyrimidine dehydrogenase PreA subunit